MPCRELSLSRGYVLAIACVVSLVACGGSAPGDGERRNAIALTDEATVFVAPTGEQMTFPAVPGVLDAEVEVAVTPTGSQGMPAEAQLLTRAVTLTFRNLTELPGDATLTFELPHLDSAGLRTQSLSSNVYVLVSGRDRAAAINERDWEHFGGYESSNDRSVLTVTKAGLDAIALSLDDQGPSLDGKPMGFQVATNVPHLFKPAAKGLYRVNLTSGSMPSVQEAAHDPIEYCHGHHSNLFNRLPSQAAPTGHERRVAVLLVHGYQSIGIPLGDNLSKRAHCNVWLNTIAAFEHRSGDWQTLRNQSDLYAVRYDTDDRVMVSGSEVALYLHQLSHQLGYQDVVILSHSMGGVVSVAARQQARYPETVKGIVTLGTPHMGAPMRCTFGENGMCMGWKYGPGTLGDLSWLLTSGISLVAPSDGGLDLTFAYPTQDPSSVANPFLVNLWLERRNAENVHAIFGSSEYPTFDTGLGGAVGRTLFGLDVGYNDMFIPASSAAGSPVLNKDGRPYASMFSRVTGVGRDHEQLHAGCIGCSDGRTSQDRYDPYFDGVARALLGFVGSGSDPVVSVSVTPTTSTLEPGATQSFTATVTNAGTTSVSWSATCGTITGTSNTITYTAPSAAGTCSLTARSVADASKSASATVTVTGGEPTPGADLVVRGLDVTPATAVAGASATVSFRVENVGDTPAGSSTVRVRINDDPTDVTTSDELLVQRTTTALAAGQSQTYTETVTLPAGLANGTHYVWVVADVFNEANQSDYNNDRSVAPIVIGGTSNLACTDPAQVIAIQDPQLEAAIRSSRDIPLAPIQCHDMWGLTELYVNGAGISDLDGIQHATNLTHLQFGHNSVSDLSYLEHLLNLQMLEFSGNDVSSIVPLEGLTNLATLSGRDNGISDVSPLANLTNLFHLDLSDNGITDISPLANLTNLGGLYLDRMSISDITPLANLVNLRVLYLRSNNISDISPLANLSELSSVHFFSNNVRDVSPLAHLTNLSYLELTANNVSNLSPLANLTNLQDLTLDSNDVSDVSPLASLTRLEKLLLGDNNIADVSSLVALTNLQSLRLSGNGLTDLAPLSGLHDLQWLGLSNNMISDLMPLADLSGLVTLNLDGNDISDVAPLANLTQLESLWLHNNSVADVSAFANLGSLQRLKLNGNSISDISALIANVGIGAGDEVDIRFNCLIGPESIAQVQLLKDRGVNVQDGFQRSCEP